jgi:hypothetical protein
MIERKYWEVWSASKLSLYHGNWYVRAVCSLEEKEIARLANHKSSLAQKRKEEELKLASIPVIVDYYAAEVIRPGDSWRIYLHAKDSDRDIKDITCVLEQTGGSPYLSVTRLKRTQGQEVAGYLLLKTPRDSYLTNDLFTMKVTVLDSQGNRSEPIELPLRFGRKSKQKIPEKWEKVSDRKLCTVRISIESSFLQEQRSRR